MALGFVAGSLQYLNTNYAPNWALTDSFSISFWLNFTGTSALRCFFGADMAGAGGNLSLLMLQQVAVPANSINWYIADSGGVSPGTITGVTTCNDGAWHLITLTRDVVADKWNYWIDTISQANPADLTTAAINLSVKLFAGAASRGGPSRYATCALDDLCIWNVALTSAQVASLVSSKRRMAAALAGGNIVRWWPLQGVNGAAASGALSVQDFSANLGHGTPVNSPLYALSPLSWPARVTNETAYDWQMWTRTGFANDPFSKTSEPSPVWTRETPPVVAWT